MSWQKLIINRLNIRKGCCQLILDKTNVLLQKHFLKFLEKQSVIYETADSLIEILSLVKIPEILIISPFIDLPEFIYQRADIKVLDYPLLPLEIDYSLAQILETGKLISLLEYRHNTGKVNLIDENNIEKELDKALVAGRQNRVDDLKQAILEFPEDSLDYEKMLELGITWGQYVYACFVSGNNPDTSLVAKVDRAAEYLVLKRSYENAFFMTERSLKTVNKILPYLKNSRSKKIALVCFDGMGVPEWELLKKYLDCPGFSEKYLFALVPTITKISRTAIFCGDYESAYSIKNVNESAAFSKYFKNKNSKFFRLGEISEENILGINRPVIIYNLFDDIAHETKLPPGEDSKTIYFNNILNYLNHSNIKQELFLLKHQGYDIYICSDHGCVAGHGNGQRIDKYLIEQSSKRATLIKESELSQFYDVNHYQIPFLSGNKTALLAKGRSMFASKRFSGISHGGITFEELIVPFAEVIP